MMIDLDTIPAALKEGEPWLMLDLDPEWVWFARGAAGEIVGILIAAPCHGLVFVYRLRMLPEAPYMSLVRLFRTFIRDLRRRGAIGYLAMLDVLHSPMEAKLARIAFNAGAMFTTASTVVMGSVAAKHVGER